MSLGRKIADLKSRRGVRYTLILLAVLLASAAIGTVAGVAVGIAAFAALSMAFLPKPELFFGDTSGPQSRGNADSGPGR